MVQAKKPLVIPVFIPHSGCPHQCAFCNQSIITSQKTSLPDKTAIHHIVTQFLEYKGKREKVELAFFGGNFLGLASDIIVQLLEFVQPYIKEKKIDGIRFSTRPDTITRSKLDLVRPYRVSTVELGVQSMNDDVLLKSKRGHKSGDTTNAIHLLKEYPFKIGAQVMVGLPDDNEASLIESTKIVAGLAPDFARIYPLMVLKGSLMEHWYKKGRYQPMSLEQSIMFVKKMVHIFQAAHVKVIRMGLQASDMMEDKSMVLAGPWHPAFGHLVFSEILYDIACNKIDHCMRTLNPGQVSLHIHPKSESRLRGNKNINLKRLRQQYPEFDFLILPDEKISINQVEIGE
ncbi:elongator complex protein 3 [Desulfobacula sp.]